MPDDDWTKSHNLDMALDYPEMRMVEAADAIEPYETDLDVCKNPECGREIKSMAFRGTGFCCVECRKACGDDVPSVGTIMFVTNEEHHEIMEARRDRIST